MEQLIELTWSAGTAAVIAGSAPPPMNEDGWTQHMDMVLSMLRGEPVRIQAERKEGDLQ